ncbi:MAG TPA: serine hydroxymethyltransferase [Solirubrobacteraceae bacterium]|jgi:glycine hydroxymethyltransferase|nr:serine hydroxymethyltransferase [Solirubrobacteraceae bacterium]
MNEELSPDALGRPVAEVDPQIAEALALELERQQNTLELIASENFVPQAVLECQGSVLTNKYAEGYPGARYYGGCEFVDIAEQLAIDRAKALFGAEHANVQPHSGAQANAAVYHALLEPGDVIMGLSLAHGGHLTHGMKKNVSGRLYRIVAYEVDRETSLIDMDEVERLAREHRPKLLLAGWSAYPRQLDFARFRAIADEVGAYLMVDMAHFAGLVAADLHPNPVDFGADVVTTTTHKTLCGPRGGVILCQERHAKEIDSAVFPGQQGGPLQHVIAAKAVTFHIAAGEAFRERQRRTLENSRALAESLLKAGNGINVLTGGTDVHLLLADLRESELSGQDAEDRLHEIRITVNRNAVPFDPRPPRVTSGLRIGSPALTTRGLGREDFLEIGEIIGVALGGEFETRREELLERVDAIVERYPLYAELEAPAAA